MVQKLDMNCQRQYPQFFYLQMHAVCRMQYGVQGDATLICNLIPLLMRSDCSIKFVDMSVLCTQY